ncbi:MAG: PaaI family thioesterase [Candidatus Abyssobacteria bacterium SURF_17]|uniref:PaaI family thioesterase n=1 Tax=Candidatus Abyssobacteria bacterium SURF_17 TaxID=2093361 RepID=A0A419EQT2_9BACT|nr:MAG: PaaI family thioesterase [Candidatus Abyssubacteria bacterium SURF_17]
MSERKAFQEQVPAGSSRRYCYGCGADNPRGLHIKSYWEGDEGVCRWRPEPFHSSGPPDSLNGGVAATLIDCHSVYTAVATAYRLEGREMGQGEPVDYATAKLTVEYKRRTPMNATLELRSRVVKKGNRSMVVETVLLAEGQECVRGEVIAVRVSPEA